MQDNAFTSALIDDDSMDLSAFTEKAYLDYSMYVILDRALPFVGDGLKPVQRRIVYAMSELGLSAQAKHKKSARTVGDVLGKYHPHGDLACYEAMVLMAQPFSYRYPLVDGQGNWGSPDDPKSFAAMRYTESRLGKYSEVLLAELAQGTADWEPNFDGSLQEPKFLPARLPNVLLNGGTGIAVGMATDIPPHNAREVAAACLHLLDNPQATVDDICQFVLGPDYPTGGEIISSREDIRRIYETGTGAIRMRARYAIEDEAIVINALPHQVSGARVLEQIAQQMQAKKLPMVEDLRDESDHENPTRLVIVPRSARLDVEAMMNHLFATTDLERNYRVNMNVIGQDGRPGVKNLRDMLTEWLAFRRETVRRRLQHRLDKVEARLHILAGLLIAYLNLDEVIRIIREEDQPKAALMARFGLTDIQADAILDTRLRHLARLEEMKIRSEQDELAREKDKIEKILGSERRMTTLLRKEIEADSQKYGDERRTPLVEREAAQALSEADLAPGEPVTVILSAKGWVRAAKGHEADPEKLAYKTGDHFLAAARGMSNEQVVFLDSTGRAYTLPANSLPSARGHGEPLTGKVSPPPGATFVTAIMGKPGERYVMASDAGYGFVINFDDLISRNKAGKAVLTLPQGAKVLPPVPVNEDHPHLVAAASSGHMLAFPLVDLPQLAKGKGVKLIDLAGKAQVVDLAVVGEHQSVAVHAGKQFVTLTPDKLKEYAGNRGNRGKKLPRGYTSPERIDVK